MFRKSYLFTKKGYINSWQTKNKKHLGKGYSDHLPVYAFFDNKPYLPAKRSNNVTKTLSTNIEYLYTTDTLVQPVELKDAVIVLKRGRYAIVKQTANGRGIFLYGCVNGLKEGEKYDLLVQDIRSYKGLKEITVLVKLKDKGTVNLNPFYSSFSQMRQNEVLRDLEATYRNRNLYIDGNKIPVYFKNKKLTPKNGSKLKIHYAHLGYYKKLQLVIYSKKDFTILEK